MSIMAERKVNQFHIAAIILIGVMLIVSACGRTIRQSVVDPYLLEPRGALGQLVIYRPYRFINSSAAPEILINDNTINDGRRNAKCITNKVTVINLPSGRYKISMRLKDILGQTRQSQGTDIVVTVARGQRVYVQCGYGEEDGPVWTRQLFVPKLELKGSGNEKQRVFDSKKYKLRGIYEIR
jgi:hypothetical protein